MAEGMSRRDFLRLSALIALETMFFPIGGGPRQALAAPLAENEDNELAYLSANEQIRRFTAGTLSPVAVLETQMERIKKYNGPLNTSGDELPDYMKFNGPVCACTMTACFPIAGKKLRNGFMGTAETRD